MGVNTYTAEQLSNLNILSEKDISQLECQKVRLKLDVRIGWLLAY